MCDGLGPIPSTASCDWSCATGYTFDTQANACVLGSNLFILFDAGTPNATGNIAAKLTSDPGNSRGLLKHKNAGACIAPFNTGATRAINFKYQALSAYNFTTVPTGPFQIVENGLTTCPPVPLPPPVYTYAWFGSAYGACIGQCGTNGTRSRTVQCKRSDGQIVPDNRCTGTKPPTTEPCAMAACSALPDVCPDGDFSGDLRDGTCMAICKAGGMVPCVVGPGSLTTYRARWCEVTDMTGNTSLGYGANNSGSTQSNNICGELLTGNSTIGTVIQHNGNYWRIHNQGEVIEQYGSYYRCDTKPDSEVDVNSPLPDYLCPAL